jgi:hypothetical protein
MNVAAGVVAEDVVLEQARGDRDPLLAAAALAKTDLAVAEDEDAAGADVLVEPG